MNQRIDFAKIGGFPFTQYTAKWMQDSYREALKGLAAMIGSKVIVSGVDVVNNVASNGWIAVNGELLPFIGGNVAASVVITETTENRTFEDNIDKTVYYKKQASFGNPGNFPFTDLKRIGTLDNIWLSKDVKMVTCDNAYLAANFDGTGLGINERKGWAVCNGNNGTADMRGLYPVGYDNRVADPNNNWWDALYNTLGNTGGSIKHVVTKNNIQEFTIGKPGSEVTGGVGFPVAGSGFSDSTIEFKVGVPVPTKIDHRSPFKVVLYIQKL